MSAHPTHAFDPQDLLTFIEMEGFTSDWEDLGLSDDDLWALQTAIMRSPRAAPVVPATGGLRKLRFAPPGWKRGKRGAVRVCYVYFQEFGIVLLVVAYSKSETDDLTPQEKKAVRQMIDSMHKVFTDHYTH